MVQRSVSICTRLPSLVEALVVLGEHDLVGHRREVDLVGLLVQVVLLGQVLRVEEVADVDGLAVGVALLRGLARLLGEREVLQRALVGEVVVAVPVAVPDVRGPPTFTSAKNWSKISSKTSSSRRSLTSATRSAARSVSRSRSMPGCARARHGVERLRGGDPHPPQAQQPDEPVDRVLHELAPPLARCS